MQLLETAGADVSYHDPHVPTLNGKSSVRARARRVRLRRDPHRALVDRPRPGLSRCEGRRRLPQRHRRRGSRRPQGLEAVTRVAVAGLGYWGPNLARNFDQLAELAWVCDADEERLSAFAARYPQARATASYDELLADDGAGRDRDRDSRADALRARAASALCGQARPRREAAGHARRGDGRARAALRGPRPRLHARAPAPLPPGNREAQGARRLRRARRRALRLRQPAEPRDHPPGRERALVARCPRPVGDLAPARRGARRGGRTRSRLPHPRRRGRRLLLPALPVREDRAHASLLARPAQDAEDHRRRHRQDGRVRRHGAGAEGDRVRERALAAGGELRRVADPVGRHHDSEDPDRRAPAARMRALPRARPRRGRPPARWRATARWSCARSSG